VRCMPIFSGVRLFGRPRLLYRSSVVYLLNHTIARVTSCILSRCITSFYTICNSCRTHVFESETSENAVFLGLRCRVCHQAAQVGIEAADGVRLAVAVPKHIQTGRALQCQCSSMTARSSVDHSISLNFSALPFFRLPTAISMPAAVIDWRITCRISSGRLTVKYAARRHRAFTRYMPPRSRATRITRSSSAGAT
jgi:hypothetical protein